MIILGIETSCDETSIAVVRNGTEVLSNVIASTKEVFSESGGVVPEDAARRQVDLILPVLHSALLEAKIQYKDIQYLACTKGPGLMGSLLVGTTAARVISRVHSIPLVGVHHTFGHLSSVWLEPKVPPVFPCITLSVSGGHTNVWFRSSHTQGVLLGGTLDDAAGEAFDKGAAMLGLPYPGGPSIAKAALHGDKTIHPFPVGLSGKKTCDSSFSGLKNALRVCLQKEGKENNIENFASSYQEAICAQLTNSVVHALHVHPEAQQIHIVGGVSANTRLRAMITETCAPLPILTPLHNEYCTDNAAMIAAAGYFLINEKPKMATEAFCTMASLPLENYIS